ncbi:MAG TPA: ATP-binding protein [Pirellulales bacterium]|nr:ATP-binding protein [Pirellulales bacterium]
MKAIDIHSLSISQIPTFEDEMFEFKSSLMNPDEFKQELDRAASGFSNSGGGCIVWGLDNKTGMADGGVGKTIGRQCVKEWVDQIVHKVQPAPKCKTHLFTDVEGRGRVNDSNAIIAVSFAESSFPPHMASDCHYYIRAGRHTVPAQHFIVEALWSKRYTTVPKIVHVVRINPHALGQLQIGLVAVTDSPALDVEVMIEPLKGMLHGLETDFPLHVPVIDQSNPFYMDISYRCTTPCDELTDDVHINVKYHDLAGNEYSYRNEAPLNKGLPSLYLADDPAEKIVRAIEGLKH